MVRLGFGSGGTVWPLQTGFSCWRPGGELVTPFGSVFPLKQLVGAAVSVISPKSPLVSFPKKPLLLNELFRRALPQSSYRQRFDGLETVPPWQLGASGGGVSVSG